MFISSLAGMLLRRCWCWSLVQPFIVKVIINHRDILFIISLKVCVIGIILNLYLYSNYSKSSLRLWQFVRDTLITLKWCRRFSSVARLIWKKTAMCACVNCFRDLYRRKMAKNDVMVRRNPVMDYKRRNFLYDWKWRGMQNYYRASQALPCTNISCAGHVTFENSNILLARTNMIYTSF